MVHGMEESTQYTAVHREYTAEGGVEWGGWGSSGIRQGRSRLSGSARWRSRDPQGRSRLGHTLGD